MEQKKFLILGSRNYANRRLLWEFKQKGHQAQILDPVRLLPFVNDKQQDRIYVMDKDATEPKRIYKNSLSGIVPRIGTDLQFFSKSVEHLNQNIGIPSTATADGLLNAQDKIRTIQMLSRAGVKTPKTIPIKKVHNLDWIVKQLGGFPVVAKLIYGSRGVGVFILTEPLSASTGLDAFSSQGHSLLLQQFIETAKKDEKKHDFRAVVVNGEVVAAIKRNSVGEDFRTNASLKEDCEGVELDDEMKDIAIKAAAAVGLSVAGVDLARDFETGEIYCYEVNGNMNFKSTEKFSKKNVAEKIVDYAIQLANGDYKTELGASLKKMLGKPSASPTNGKTDTQFEIDKAIGLLSDGGIPFDYIEQIINDDDDDVLENEMSAFSTGTMVIKSKDKDFLQKVILNRNKEFDKIRAYDVVNFDKFPQTYK